jgi:hypothetical protein
MATHSNGDSRNEAPNARLPSWEEERADLIQQVRVYKAESRVLAKRFRVLQKTLDAQKLVLDKYQRKLLRMQSKKQRSILSVVPKLQHAPIGPACNDESPPLSPLSPPLRTVACERMKVDEVATNVVPPIKSASYHKLEPAAIANTSRHHLEEAANNVQEPIQERKPAQRDCLSNSRVGPVLTKTSLIESTHIQRSDGTEISVNTARTRSSTKNPSYKFIEVVRKKDERAALPGHECLECAKYYYALGPEFQGQCDLCSRHRAKHEPYATPEDFWRLSFPDSIT